MSTHFNGRGVRPGTTSAGGIVPGQPVGRAVQAPVSSPGARPSAAPSGSVPAGYIERPTITFNDDATFDTLTDLFLGDLLPERSTHANPQLVDLDNLDIEQVVRTDGSDVQQRGHARASGVELLILGHLPALASVWGTQHIRELAQADRRAVASVRLQDGYVSVEVFGECGREIDRAQSLDAALAAIACVTGRVVLRVDESHELALAASDAVSSITLLTGADEAATIGAYRTIKSLAVKLADRLGPAPEIRVVVTGADMELARSVGGRVASTAKSQLGREVRVDVAPAKIGAPAGRGSIMAFNGKTELHPEALAQTVLSTLRAGQVRRVHTPVYPFNPPAESRTESSIAQPLTRRSPIEPAAPSLPSRVDQPAPTRANSATEFPVPSEEAASSWSSSPGATPSSTPVLRAIEPEPTVRLSLSGHVTGLSAVSITCPYAEGVEFAVDDGGRLHVLGRLDTQRADEAALRDLMVASEWAQVHSQLLKLAAQSLGDRDNRVRLDTDEMPIMHLFSSEPRKVRRLLETDVRVHLLSPVCVGGKSGWFCTPLN